MKIKTHDVISTIDERYGIVVFCDGDKILVQEYELDEGQGISKEVPVQFWTTRDKVASVR